VEPTHVESRQSTDAERERRWQVIEQIGARNRDKDPEEVERDIAEALAEVRAEMRSERPAKVATPGQ
jgi:hypothetical protein